MADVSKIKLTPSLLMLAKLVGVYGAYTILKYVVLLVIGVIANVATDGSITVTSTISDYINGSDTTATTVFTAIDAGVTIVVGLIGLVVILQLFWALIKPYMSENKGGKGGNSNF